MHYTREFYSSAVLRDGRVFVAGGEVGTGGNKAEIYDPNHDTWTEIPVPAGLICTNCSGPGFSDSGCVILKNGSVLIAPVRSLIGNGTVIYDPVANAFTQGPACGGNQNEATWVKLPDDSILTIDATSTGSLPNSSERYIPSLNTWTNDAPLPIAMYNAVQETGAGVLLPDGRVFYIGGLGHTAYYTPSGGTSPGSWTQGPDLVSPGVGWDEPAAVMVNGKVLYQTALGPLVAPPTPQPRAYYELDPTSNYPVGVITQAIDWGDTSGFTHRMLNLPDGTVLVSYGATILRIYRPDGVPVPAGKPTISAITANGDGSYHLIGTRLNGMSQGSSVGDDAQMDSNYPLVRLTDSSGNTYYGITYNWSSTSVATGNTPVTTEFSLPLLVYGNGGPFSLVVVANGISADAVSFTPTSPNAWVDFTFSSFLEFGSFFDPYSSLNHGVNGAPPFGGPGVPSGSTIFIKGPGLSTESLTITKAVTIYAIGGSVTIGN
jgi:hypothetical protein